VLPNAGEAISIVEVAPRDGLQNEPQVLQPKQRAEFIRRLAAAGLNRLEAGSFVNPKWIPAMAGTAEVLQELVGLEGLRASVLTPNARGFADALACPVNEVAVFMSASESHNQKNTNCSTVESLARFDPMLEQARSLGVSVRGYLSVVAGCPYEGEVSVARVVRLGRRLLEMGCYELSLGDTIGVATPRQIHAILDGFDSEGIAVERLALHLHDTRGTALANVVAGLERGVRCFDSSAGGLGGCPYAPGASGNLATEDLVYLCDTMGLKTGVDLDALVEVSRWMGELLGKRPVSRVWQAVTAGKDL
jgi:hydroxymethylglutaryl-CoA lyase